MSTRSAIILKTSEGKYRSIYCHSDGYLEHNGKILHEHFQDPEKVEQLINLGGLSVLAPEIGEKHDFDDFDWMLEYLRKGDREGREADPRNNWCRFYHRDRGEPWDSNKPEEFSVMNIAHYRSHYGAEYIYLFEDGVWKVHDVYSNYGNTFIPLSDAFTQLHIHFVE
jgi:hypothetical protein